MPVGPEAPAVIAAFDLAAVEAALRQRHAAMRADVAQREDLAGAVAADQHRLAEHLVPEHPAAPNRPARRRVIPGLAQRRRAILDRVVPPLHSGDIARASRPAQSCRGRREGYLRGAAGAIFAAFTIS